MRGVLHSWVAACAIACGSDGAVPSNSGPASDGSVGNGGADASGCTRDTDCKGARICDKGHCVDPMGSGGQNAGGRAGAGASIPVDAGSDAQPSTGGACGARQQPESIIIYRDATVTDTITKYKPVALFLMLDRSGGMTNDWTGLTAAITTFVNDSDGLDVGFGTFPYGPNNTADCLGSDCGLPVVPIAPLPQNATAIVQGVTAQAPSSATAPKPIECGIRGMINTCLVFMAQSSIGEQCVAALITDGAPTQCSSSAPLLQQIVKDGHDRGVTTFVLGLPGADLSALDAIATAGGTTSAIDASGGTQAIVTALGDIRRMTSASFSTQATSHTVIPTALVCEWKIPPIPSGQVFDATKVNLEFTPPGGARQTFTYVPTRSDCSNEDAWYYDDPQNPTRIRLCPSACSRMTSNPAADVDLVFGCPTTSLP